MTEATIQHTADLEMVRSFREMLSTTNVSLDLLEMRFPHLAESCARLRGAARELSMLLGEIKHHGAA